MTLSYEEKFLTSDEDRPVCVLWLQDLSRPWQDPRQGRRQELQVPQQPHPQGPHAERNPREVTWTVLYRRKHKKGLEEETAKKRNKRTTKFQRAVVGATLQDIMAKRNQKPEVRKAQ